MERRPSSSLLVLIWCGAVVAGCGDDEPCGASQCAQGAGGAGGAGGAEGGAGAGVQEGAGGNGGDATSGGGGEGGDGGGAECVPSPEDCVTVEDEDCDGETPPCSGAHLWTATFGLGEWASLRADPSGAVYAAAQNINGFTFGDASYTGPLVLKLDGSGAVAWFKPFVSCTIYDMAVLADGTVIVVGYRGVAGPDASLDISGPGPFIVALGPDGATKEGRTVYSQQVLFDAVEPTADGDFFLFGRARDGGAVDLGTGTTIYADGDKVLAARIDGQELHAEWLRLFGENGELDPRDVAIDELGRPAVVGEQSYSSGGVDYGGGYILGSGVYVLLEENGGYEESFATPDRIVGVEAAPGGTILLGNSSTQTESSLSFYRVDLDGVVAATTKFLTTQSLSTRGQLLSADPFGNLLYTGTPADFGGTLTKEDVTLAVAKLRVDGSLVWDRAVGDVGASVSVVTAGPNAVFVGGYAAAGATVEGETFDQGHLFVVALAP